MSGLGAARTFMSEISLHASVLLTVGGDIAGRKAGI